MNMFDVQDDKEEKYSKLLSEKLFVELKKKIEKCLLHKKKFKVWNYTAKQLAIDLNTNERYVTAVIRVAFHTNYSNLVNRYRVEEAKKLLADSKNDSLNIEDIAAMAGFVSRSSFHSVFKKYVGITPLKYRENINKDN